MSARDELAGVISTNLDSIFGTRGNWVSWLNPGENSTWMATGRRGPFALIHEGGKP